MENNNDDGINNELRTGQITMYMLISLSVILVFVDCIEIMQLTYLWDNSLQLNKEVFNSCLKWELIFRTCNSVLSTCAAISALAMSLGVLLHTYGYQVKDFFGIIFHYLYMIFGAIMLGLSLLCFLYFRNIFYICDKSNLTAKGGTHEDNKRFAFGNFITIIITLCLSLSVVLLVMSTKVSQFFMASYHRKYGGSNLYRKIFWSLLVKKRPARELMQEAVIVNAQIEENKASEQIVMQDEMF